MVKKLSLLKENSHDNMSILKPKDMQKAQKPSARVGSGQSPRVPTHEGSQLGSPKKAKVTKKRTPHL